MSVINRPSTGERRGAQYLVSGRADPRSAIAQQSELTREAFERRGVPVKCVYFERGFDPLSPARPALGKLLEWVAAGNVDVVGVDSRHRLASDEAEFVRLLAHLRAHGCSLLVVDEDREL